MLISLIETIKKSLDHDRIMCIVFIDLQKAFDTINHEILLNKLNHYGIRNKENDWFHSFLTNRKQCVNKWFLFSNKNCMMWHSSWLYLGTSTFLNLH